MPVQDPAAQVPEEAFFLLPILIVTVALALTQILTGFARVRVGRPLAADRRSGRARKLGMSALVLALAVVILVSREVALLPAMASLTGTLALVLTTPGFHDALLCEHGVQRGWHARRFESLEEWRLTGEHLRFRLLGEWTAVPCPHALQAEVRAKLVQLAPERESPFQD